MMTLRSLLLVVVARAARKHQQQQLVGLMPGSHKKETDPQVGIIWQDVDVRSASGSPLLQQCTGWALAGRLTVILGPSGAGKTTMLRALAKAGGGSIRVSGEVRRVDGENLGGLREGDAALLAQDSELFGQLTALELVRFAYEMRGASRSNALAWSRESLERFGLSDVSGRRVGDTRSAASASANRGGSLSGGERRRLCVAIELALTESTRLSLLAADEATSGLDSVAAERVVAMLAKFARERKVATVAALHQPSSKVWLEHIDDVCVLVAGGRVMYHGDAKIAPQYFCREFGVKLPAHTNPAEWLLDLATSPSVHVFCDAWEKHRKKTGVASAPQLGTTQRRRRPRRPSRFRRLSLLLGRSLKQVLRDKRIHALRLFGTVGLGLFLADRYGCDTPPHHTDPDTLDVSCIADRVALLSFSAISMSMLSFVRSLDLFAKERPVVGRERERGLYGGYEYVIAKALAELPTDCAFAALHGATLACRLRHSQGTRLRCRTTLPLAAVAAASSSLGLAIGAASSSEAALAIGTPVMVVHMLTGIINPSGSSRPPEQYHAGSHFNWLQVLSPVRHCVVWLLVREFKDAKLSGNPVKRGPAIGGLALVRDGNAVLSRLAIADPELRPANSLAQLTALHLALATAFMSAPTYRTFVGVAIIKPVRRLGAICSWAGQALCRRSQKLCSLNPVARRRRRRHDGGCAVSS